MLLRLRLFSISIPQFKTIKRALEIFFSPSFIQTENTKQSSATKMKERIEKYQRNSHAVGCVLIPCAPHKIWSRGRSIAFAYSTLKRYSKCITTFHIFHCGCCCWGMRLKSDSLLFLSRVSQCAWIFHITRIITVSLFIVCPRQWLDKISYSVFCNRMDFYFSSFVQSDQATKSWLVRHSSTTSKRQRIVWQNEYFCISLAEFGWNFCVVLKCLVRSHSNAITMDVCVWVCVLRSAMLQTKNTFFVCIWFSVHSANFLCAIWLSLDNNIGKGV